MNEAAIRAAFREQARSCRSLGSEFTATLCETLADILEVDQGAVARKILTWQGDPTSRADSVPLRLCGSLHALSLTNAAPELAGAYARLQVDPDLILQALSHHEQAVLDWLRLPPQTNEVARSAALIPAARFVGEMVDLQFRVLELGASAGLNLNFDNYVFDTELNSEFERVILNPEFQGAMPKGQYTIASAAGVDMNPLDPIKDSLRLRSYCWPDQPQRMARLNAALALARRHPNPVDKEDAGAWLSRQLERPAKGMLTFVMHTIAAQYFPPETLAACEYALKGSPEAPLAHVAMEYDGGDGARLSLRLWDGELRGWILGRADFHGRWIKWNPTQLAPQDVKQLALSQTPTPL